MSILTELNTLMEQVGLPVQTGAFLEEAPFEYVVLVSIIDSYDLWADDWPLYDIQEARISLYSKGNFQQRRHQIERALLAQDFNIDERRYIGREDDTGYHHYVIDVEKAYKFREEEEPWQPSV